MSQVLLKLLLEQHNGAEALVRDILEDGQVRRKKTHQFAALALPIPLMGLQVMPTWVVGSTSLMPRSWKRAVTSSESASW